MADDALTDAQEAAPPPDDIRSALAAAFDESQAPSTDAPEKPAPATSERPRAPDGKFTKVDDAAPVEAPSEPAEPTSQAKPEEPKPDLDVEVAKATARWSPADREMLGKLPPEARDFMIRRHREMEADHTRKTTEIAAFRRDYEPVEQLFAPHVEQMRARGFTKAGLIGAWAAVEMDLMKGGDTAADVLAGIARNYRIDNAAIAKRLGITQAISHAPADPPAPEGATPQLSPEVVQRLERAERWIQQQDHVDHQRQQMAMQDAASRVMGEIEQFTSATDSAGALLHPHFREVEDDMVRLSMAVRASGKQPVLSELYDQAVWANPSTRQKLQAEMVAAEQAQREKAEKQRQDEARAKAERARRAGSSVTGGPGAGQSGRNSDGSLRSELEANFERTSAAA